MPPAIPIALADHPRAVPFTTTVFEAFRITDGLPAERNTFPLGIVAASTLAEATNEAIRAVSLAHKDHLLIRETDNGRVRLHLFAVRRKATPRYEHRDHVTRAVHDFYLAPVCAFDGGAL